MTGNTDEGYGQPEAGMGGDEFCFGHTEKLEVLENLLWARHYSEYPTWSTAIIFMTI